NDGQLYINKQLTSNYSHTIQSTTHNSVYKRFYSRWGQVDESEGIYIDLYDVNSIKFNLIAKTQTDYKDPLPLYSRKDTDGYLKIITKQEFQYPTYVGLP